MTAAQSVEYFFSKKYKCKPWILSVIHSFGAQLNRNPHVHLILTAWWISWNTFKKANFIPYNAILSSWKKFLLKHLKERCYKNLENSYKEIRLLNYLYSQKNKDDKEKSRYIYFSKKARSFNVVLSYIGRYLKRPTISQSRILSYDWNYVTYSYKDKLDWKVKQITCSATRFIGLLIQHLPNKNFHMIYYHGIFANRCKAKYLRIINSSLQNPLHKNNTPSSFSQRLFFFTWINPRICSCWWTYFLSSISIPGYPTKYFDSW